ncbi:unnamed protein product [Mytilus coruscus]|uniref:Uncharacterized protein n=1 Tax=Mytilus coruscus TaxID=42192 RepID=A0A6J8DWX0_MYTCO|nr:unnamed protein product [Mytilus coruscus]
MGFKQNKEKNQLDWDNPQPPVKKGKILKVHPLRGKVMVFVSEVLTGRSSMTELVSRANNNIVRLIPRRREILLKAQIQLEGLFHALGWNKPEKYTLLLIVSPCIFTHWRYQVLLCQYLLNEQLQSHMCLDRKTNEMEQKTETCRPIEFDRRIEVKKRTTGEEPSIPYKRAKRVESSEPLEQMRNVLTYLILTFIWIGRVPKFPAI